MKELVLERIAELLSVKGGGTWEVGVRPTEKPGYILVYTYAVHANRHGAVLVSERTLWQVPEDMLVAALFHAAVNQTEPMKGLVIDDLGDMK